MMVFAKIPHLKFFVKIYFRLYERKANTLWRDPAMDYPRSRLGRLKIFHIKALKRAVVLYRTVIRIISILRIIYILRIIQILRII